VRLTEFNNRQGVAEGLAEDAVRAEAQAAYMQGECMILAVAINRLDPERYPIGYIWEYNMSAGAPDMQLDDDEWEYLSPEEQEEVSKDISRHSVVHAYVRDQETGEYIDARGRHKTLPNLWGRMGQTRFDEFPGTARELIDITAHGDWDEVGEKVDFKRGQPAFDSLAGPAGVKRAQDYAVKYLGVEASKNKAPGIDQQGVAESAEQVAIAVRKGRNKFATEMTVNGEPAGSYQYDANTGRSIAEVDPKYKGKGYGKILVLHAIYTAAMSGMDFVEDESRTSEYDNVLDSLDSNGYAINDDGYWYVTEEGEQFLKQALKQDVDEEIAEGWKDWVAGGAMALGAMGAQANSIVTQIVDPGDTVYSIARQNNVNPSVLFKLNGFNNNTKLTPGQEVKVPDVYTKDAKPAAKPAAKVSKPAPVSVAKTVSPITGNRAEQLLMNTAIRSGITGTELAAFMAQMAHESDDFKSMKEYGGSLDFRKYDPKYAPKKAKTLGNKYAGDGNRFKGRGFIQITGRYNYGIASKAIGVDLVKNPKLAENPAVAAKIAVWYWKLRVQPNVTNFNDVEAVTKPINPGLRGLEDRKENFNDYITAMAQPGDTAS
jgi:putative chitinase